MLKNFNKVFRFTFRHQTESKGYRILTIVLSVILFLAPVVTLVLLDVFHEKGKDKTIESCGAERVIFVDELVTQNDFGMLAASAAADGLEDYAKISYEWMDGFETALSDVRSKGETHTLVVVIDKTESGLYSTVIIPKGSEITEKKAGNLEDFLKKYGDFFTVLASGVSPVALQDLSNSQEADVFDQAGYNSRNSLFADSKAQQDKKNEEILGIFRMLTIFICMFAVYFIVLSYGTTIMNCVIMEKSSKLMDTMLISVSPEAMVFGKMLGVLLAGVIQLLSWLLSIVLGFVVGYQVVIHMNPDSTQGLIVFLKSVGEMGVFTPGRILIALVVLAFSLILYASLATIGGAISFSREDVASKQSLFTILLVASFFIVMAKGMGDPTPAWLCLVPFTASMALPGAAAGGSVSVVTSLLGLGIMVVCSLVFIYLSGRLYKMMSLYKGNSVSYSKAFKMLLNMKDNKEKA